MLFKVADGLDGLLPRCEIVIVAFFVFVVASATLLLMPDRAHHFAKPTFPMYPLFAGDAFFQDILLLAIFLFGFGDFFIAKQANVSLQYEPHE